MDKKYSNSPEGVEHSFVQRCWQLCREPSSEDPDDLCSASLPARLVSPPSPPSIALSFPLALSASVFLFCPLSFLSGPSRHQRLWSTGMGTCEPGLQLSRCWCRRQSSWWWPLMYQLIWCSWKKNICRIIFICERERWYLKFLTPAR